MRPLLRRTLTAAALAATIAAGAIAPAQAAGPEFDDVDVVDYYKLLKDSTPVYHGAAASWGQKTSLSAGIRVTVTHKTSRSGWYRIRYDGGAGYVWKSHLGAAGFRPIDFKDEIRYTKHTSPVYNGAGTSWGKRRTLNAGVRLRITHKTNREGWYRATYTGGAAYIWHTHLATTKPQSPTSSPGRSGIPAYSQTAASVKNVVIGKYKFGPSGCVPTSFAMVAKSYGKNVTPLSVGKTMHAKSDFNRTVAGAGGKSIVAAGAAYGLKVTPLKSKAQIKAALLKNKPVLAAQRGPSSIINPGYTHEVVLNGYTTSGTTSVTNPLGGTKRSYSLDTVWNWRSLDPFDQNAGGGAVYWQVG